jgi:hypothetical protein
VGSDICRDLTLRLRRNRFRQQHFYPTGVKAMFTYQRKSHATILPIAKPNGAERVEQYREKTVDALHQGADAARVMAKRASKAVRRTGDKLDHAADYVENYDISQAPRDLTAWVKKHPTPFLALAAVGGFWFARSMRK